MTIKLNEKELDYLGEIIECDYIARKEYVENYDNDNTKQYKKDLKVANNLYKKLFGVSLD